MFVFGFKDQGATAVEQHRPWAAHALCQVAARSRKNEQGLCATSPSRSSFEAARALVDSWWTLGFDVLEAREKIEESPFTGWDGCSRPARPAACNFADIQHNSDARKPFTERP